MMALTHMRGAVVITVSACKVILQPPISEMVKSQNHASFVPLLKVTK